MRTVVNRDRIPQSSNKLDSGQQLLPNLWNTKTSANLPSEIVSDLCVAGNGFSCTGRRICPERVRGTFSFQNATVAAQVLQQGAALQFKITVPRSASAGKPRNPSSRRSSRMSAIA